MAKKRDRTVTADPVYPNAGVGAWYREQLQTLVRRMAQDMLDGVKEAFKDGAPLATDGVPFILAAGVKFVSGERFLLLRRSDNSGWGWPGGGVEHGETPDAAARREVCEELGLNTNWFNHPFVFSHVQAWKDVRFATFECHLSEPFLAPIVLNDEHTAYRWVTLAQAASMPLHPGVRATLFEGAMAQDARPKPSRVKLLRKNFERWSSRWATKMDRMSLNLSLEFATRSRKATDHAMRKTLSDAGFTVKFQPTKASIQAYEAVISEQVGLIRTIPQKFLSDVEVVVWQGVMQGSNMKQVSEQIEQKYGVAHRRAALIASDQNSKAKAAMERARRKEVGITEAVWQHSGGGVEPRETHVHMDEKRYNIDEGMYDPAVDKQVWPGTEINCRCTDRAVVPGFD